MTGVEESRRRVEEQLERLSSALEREVGWYPERGWKIALAAFAVGFAIGGAWLVRRRLGARHRDEPGSR